MMKLKTLSLAAAFCLALPLVANAATCSQSFYRSVVQQAAVLEQGMAKCNRELRKRQPNAVKMCNACGQSFARIDRFERLVRNKASCFAGDRKTQRNIRQLSSFRAEIKFLRRGCGI